ncbi:MAG TPA: endonuclease/exonuclease/phosphatase family protein [Steroidobacteraceae bacterium]|nr:endonuclease/exonuclease/phosphatase family protein [Steroidobacteraceae bacterium]
MLPINHRLIRNLLFTATILLAAASISLGAEPANLRLMTYNIRLDIASDGDNAWPHRRGWVIAQIGWLHPDIFGMQEVLPNQKADLIAALPQYRVLGGGRDDGGDKGEASPLGFDRRKFDLVDSGMFWLSPTPDVPSKGWDAAYNRVATWARLRLRGRTGAILAINTHWDHIGMVARKESALQIVKWIEAHRKRCERVMLFGDFNSEIDTEPLRHLREAGLRDAREAAKSPPFGPGATFNGFKNPDPQAHAIDHFLLGREVEVNRYMVLAQLIDGRWPSDHFPVLVEVTVPACR